jgi:cbb3-type cytochrome oxidase maturation protein
VSIVYVLLPVALLLAIAGVVAFIWSVRQGQYDDLDTPAMRVLHEDADASPRSDRE